MKAKRNPPVLFPSENGDKEEAPTSKSLSTQHGPVETPSPFDDPANSSTFRKRTKTLPTGSATTRSRRAMKRSLAQEIMMPISMFTQTPPSEPEPCLKRRLTKYASDAPINACHTEEKSNATGSLFETVQDGIADKTLKSCSKNEPFGWEEEYSFGINPASMRHSIKKGARALTSSCVDRSELRSHAERVRTVGYGTIPNILFGKQAKNIAIDASLPAWLFGSCAMHLMTSQGLSQLVRAGCQPEWNCNIVAEGKDDQANPTKVILNHNVELAAESFGVSHVAIAVESEYRGVYGYVTSKSKWLLLLTPILREDPAGSVRDRHQKLDPLPYIWCFSMNEVLRWRVETTEFYNSSVSKDITASVISNTVMLAAFSIDSFEGAIVTDKGLLNKIYPSNHSLSEAGLA